MFTRKVSVQDLITTVYGKSHELFTNISCVTREEMIEESNKALIPYKPVNDDYLYGEIEGVNFVLDLLDELIHVTMLSKEEEEFIELVEECRISACDVLHKRNPGRSLGRN